MVFPSPARATAISAMSIYKCNLLLHSHSNSRTVQIEIEPAKTAAALTPSLSHTISPWKEISKNKNKQTNKQTNRKAEKQ